MSNTELWDKLGKVYGSTQERILNRISVVPFSGCWIWMGSVGKSGYGTMTFLGSTKMAHRISYQEFVGKIPDMLHIDHKCKVRCCVNPSHLEAVTVSENNRRSPNPPSAPKTHCIRGHKLTGFNLVVDKRGWRSCRECRNAVSLKLYREKRSK